MFSRVRRELGATVGARRRGARRSGLIVTSSPSQTRSRAAIRGTCPSATSTRLPAACRHSEPVSPTGKQLPARTACHRARRHMVRDAMADDVTWEAGLRLGCVRSRPRDHTATRRGRDRDGVRLDAFCRSDDCPPPSRWIAPTGEPRRWDHLPSSVAGQAGGVFGPAVRRQRLGYLRPHVRSVLTQDRRGESPRFLPRSRRARCSGSSLSASEDKTVVLFLDNISLPTERFPAFIASANRLLRSVTFAA